MSKYFLFAFSIIYSIPLLNCNNECSKTICNPNAGDLLIGRETFLRSSSTCGLNGIETYCVVTTSDRGRKSKCNICYSKDPYQTFSSANSHRIENIVSRLPQDPNRWWQSANGIHNVSIEISFESEFQFTFTHLRFKTYRPAAMYIERSKDYGRTWEKYAYFSENCKRDFPSIPSRKRNNMNEVLCTSEYSSIIPSEGGTMLFSPDMSDWQSNDPIWNKNRNDFTAITNLRVQFVRLHTLGDLQLDDNPNIRNKYYYAISEWVIRGRCSCYGHASRCNPKEGQIKIKEMVYGVCECLHNTVGQHCEKCADFYNDTPWLPADKNSTNECKKCKCNDHAVSCHFNPVVYDLSGKSSGGVCDNCQHNTESKNCERCKSGYYRNIVVPITSENTCSKCQCNSEGSKFPEHCIQETESDRNLIAGNCICKQNVEGNHCDRCKIGFWKLNERDEKGCTKCNCVMMGTIDNQGCDSINGNCYCKINVVENDCSTCKTGYFNLSSSNPDGCTKCKCNKHGSIDVQLCDKFSGQCNCKAGYTGKSCNEIKKGWFVEKPRYPLKYREEIKIELPPVSKSGYYNLIITMDTQQMQIFDTYIIALGVDHSERSSCPLYQNTMKLTKDTKLIVVPNKCFEKDLGITVTVEIVEQPADRFLPPAIIDIIVVPMLDANSSTTRSVLKNCLKYNQSMLPKECEFINTETSSKIVSNDYPKKCDCNVTGSVNNICDKNGGQCLCLPNVTGRKCDRCASNSYGFDARGCRPCNCEPKGSLNLQCSSDTGECLCRNGVRGQHCNSCKPGYWNFPFCDSCKCNHLSDICDQKNGKCLNCRGNSFGFNCQQCNNGFYGEPSRGIPCLKCNCPGQLTNRNNSIGCSLIFNTTTYFCLCKPGYTGRYCDSCDINHFGNPLDKDGACSPCKCSGNIDTKIKDSCNTKTGECIKCLHNTTGFNCEKCASGYFGNGATRTCQTCVCNKFGTNLKNKETCNPETGKCPCLPNVVGQECDQCENGFYNISSKIGCVPCQCDYPIGSTSTSCNKETGQCNCKSTRSGLKCNNCEDGFWGDPRIVQGCKVCICNPEGSLFKQCDRNDGACRCKPGITGRYCDQCMKGTDGEMPNCTTCGSCWLQWDLAIENLETSISNISTGQWQNQTNIRYPNELDFLIKDKYGYMSFSKSMVQDFPPGLRNTIKGIEMRLRDINNLLEKINSTGFNLQRYSIANLTLKIDSAKNMVSVDKIKDIEGAYNEIKKSFQLISSIVIESNKLFKQMNDLRNKLLTQNKNLKKIQVENIDTRYKKLDDLLNTILQNLKTFNSMTCNANSNNNPLKCSAPCGGVGCKPDMCYRKNFKDCLTNSDTVFNSIAWSIEKNNRLKPNLQMLQDEVNNLTSKNIRKPYLKFEEDYNNTANLINIMNSKIQPIYVKAKELLKKLENSFNGSTNERDFKLLVQNIGKFDLSVNKREIPRLEEEIFKKKVKLNDVMNILEQSKDNRMRCDGLKKAAIQAKENGKYILSSIANMSDNYKNAEKFKNISNDLFTNFTKMIIEMKNNLKKISDNQNQTDQKQNNIFAKINEMTLMESKIKNLLNNFTKNADNLKMEQNKNIINLNNIKNKINVAKDQLTSKMNEDNLSDENTSENFRKLINRLQSISEKIKRGSNQLKSVKKTLLDKESALEKLNESFNLKLDELNKVQDRIYLKSEYNAKCLP